jgi:hypothetical protein
VREDVDSNDGNSDIGSLPRWISLLPSGIPYRDFHIPLKPPRSREARPSIFLLLRFLE